MDPLSLDVVHAAQDCLAKWENGGSASCRKILMEPHSNPLDPSCNDVLTTVYHTLLASTLSSWSPKHTLTTDSFIVFVQSVLDHVPSSSISAVKSSNTVIFGEILVDIVWTIDAELEEILADTKAATNAEQGSAGLTAKDKEDIAATVAKVLRSKQNAEADKATLATIVRRLLTLGVLDTDVCRERLDISLIANAGLITDKNAFERKEIRTRTGLFYKQNKFNLLREQSEGYSKLTTELTSCLGPPNSSATGYPVESLTSIEARARPAWERVVGLIGYFDLDPNRALDIILDIFSTHLATHHTFFVSFLSFSPWSVRRKEHRSGKEDAMAVGPDGNQYRGKSLDEVLFAAEASSNPWTAEPPRFSSEGSHTRVLAQVLGFKFSHYQSPEVSEITPHSLFLMTAILVREGFITLEDVYAHISPTDEDMDNWRKEYLATVDARISGAKISQLAMAAPLESGTQSSKSRPAVSSEPKRTSETKEVPNQKLGLLNALLSVGALRPAVAILSKFPWLVDAFPEVADLMLRILKLSLSALYDSTQPTKERNASFTQPRARFGPTGVVAAPERKPHLTLCAPTPPSTINIDFVFFFPDWSQRVPICSTLDDLVDVIEPLMHFIGLHISRDNSFFTKFLRLGRTHLQQTVVLDPDTRKPTSSTDLEHPIRLFWFKILRLYLLPALPLIRGNAVCTVEVWNIMRLYDTTLRWQLYGEWKSSTYKSHPELRLRRVQTDRESKGILRRVSKNTMDTLSGAVAKLAHSNPCIFFANAVNQIMAYSNMAEVVIQALNYVTIMGFDVLVYIVLEALANPHKDRFKIDGVNTSDWLQNLASFTGMLFRRYSADLNPLLKYIVHQLHGGQTTEIVVLRELISKMAGIEPLPGMTDSQITAMAGGPVLRIEAVASRNRGARLDPSDAGLKGPQRLGRALLESSLAQPLLIQVAQQRQSCVFQAPNAHLKSLANLYDTTHGVLLQYIELLTSPAVVPPQDYAQRILPSLTDLSEKYGICAPICMQMVRPVLSGALLSAALEMQERERVASEEAEKRLKAALTAKREPNASTSRVASPGMGDNSTATESHTDARASVAETHAADVSMESPSEGQGNSTPHTTESPWLPELYPYFDVVKKIAPGNAAEIMGPGFYLTFWQLSTYDLTPPAARYDEECAALRALSRQEDARYNAADRSSDRAKRLTAANHRDRRNRYNTYVNLLGQELKEQTAARVFTIKRLAREKQHWFSHNPKAAVLAASFIEHCLQPRCLLSPMDADFCAQFIKVIHSQGTPGFSTLMCYDKILGDHVKVVIFSCSEYEAKNYGRFLLGILTDVAKWYLDEQAFLQENRTKTGGKTTYLPGLQRRWTAKSALTIEDIIPWLDYKQIVRKWHRKLLKASSCLLDCIETAEFMHVYNAIVVLKEILPAFPVATVNEYAGSSLNMAMERLLDKEDRGDIKIFGRAYLASLKKREASWMAPKTKVGDTYLLFYCALTVFLGRSCRHGL
ncbi:transcription factor/nuclear export subunit protein 2-domain-containing protein [Sparassis latifolia]